MWVVGFWSSEHRADTDTVLTFHQNPSIPTYPHFSKIVDKSPHTLFQPVIRVIHPGYSVQLFRRYYGSMKIP